MPVISRTDNGTTETVTPVITLSGQVVANVDTSVNGTYTITANYSDDAGNAATPLVITVNVAAVVVNPTVTKTATFTLPEPILNRVGVKFSVTDLNLNQIHTGTLTTTSANVTIDLDGVDVTNGQTLILFATDLTGSNDSTAYVMCDTANAVVTQG